MRRALATFAHGPYTELLDISRPSFVDYAERHGYDYVETLPDGDRSRPAPWWKLPALRQMLSEYDAVLWLGCDVVIVKADQDIAKGIPAMHLQAMVRHHTPEGEIPNTDVWYTTRAMQPWLEQAWELTQYTNHPWWEQAAILHLMGYDLAARPLSRTSESALCTSTHFLPLEWNSHESACKHPDPRFAHATHGPLLWRKAIMQNYAVRRTA